MVHFWSTFVQHLVASVSPVLRQQFKSGSLSTSLAVHSMCADGQFSDQLWVASGSIMGHSSRDLRSMLGNS